MEPKAPASELVNFFTSDCLSPLYFWLSRKEDNLCLGRSLGMEARAGIEPAIELLQSPALPLGYPASQRTRHLRAQWPPFKFLVKQESLLACKTPKRSDKKIGDDIRFVNTHEPFIQPVLPDRQVRTV